MSRALYRNLDDNERSVLARVVGETLGADAVRVTIWDTPEFVDFKRRTVASAVWDHRESIDRRLAALGVDFTIADVCTRLEMVKVAA